MSINTPEQLRPQATFAMDEGLRERIFSKAQLQSLGHLVTFDHQRMTDDNVMTADFEETELIIGGWGCPVLSEAVLDRMPKLRGVVYTAGSVKPFVTEELFERGIHVSSGAATNALPVAEYTLAAILFSGKRVFQMSSDYKSTRQYRPFAKEPRQWGNYGLRVGIVGASRIGRRVIELLAPFDVEVLLYDPVATDDVPGARRVELDVLLRSSDVVSLHAPEIPETFRMINARALATMQSGATLINTARGSLVDEHALVAELASGRIHAVIDVTEVDPLPSTSPLFGSPNLILTPHIAGSQGNELFRLGQSATQEVSRFVRNQRFVHQITLEAQANMA